ncbi:hypothetical protein PM082_013910 [Marasmius tenuissimus]|nr:hypothetical protein PM082_013910 [Marasmius tenuissimus]
MATRTSLTSLKPTHVVVVLSPSDQDPRMLGILCDPATPKLAQSRVPVVSEALNQGLNLRRYSVILVDIVLFGHEVQSINTHPETGRKTIGKPAGTNNNGFGCRLNP